MLCSSKERNLDMAGEEASAKKIDVGDKYRSFLHDEENNIQWRHGGPPTYDEVNKLFEQGRTKVLDLYLIFTFSLSYLHD